MRTITIPKQDFWDERNNQFIKQDESTFTIEHSLVSLSKWEQIWEKPFLGETAKTKEETLSYVGCMIQESDFDHSNLLYLSNENITDINNYIDQKMTATTFNERPSGRGSREIITAEVIYYWMVTQTIPFETQYWHLNRLLTLIKVISHKNAPQKKMSRRDIAAQNRALNAQRREQQGHGG